MPRHCGGHRARRRLSQLASTLEGSEPAAWFTARGDTAFVLTYRVGNAARLPTVLADGDRAIRFVRAHARDFGIDPTRIGMIGFSAGGHLAASTALGMAGAPRAPRDGVDQASGRPDFLVLGYPWLEAAKVNAKGNSAYCEFAAHMKIPCKAEDYTAYLPLHHVSATAPPTFIYHTSNDETVPVEGSIAFYQALRAQRVDIELHAFETGRHGTGLGGADPALSTWTELLAHWLGAHGLIGSDARGPL